MATVKPFKAMRFTKEAGKIEEILCPPYDIISEEERLAFIEKNENNIIRLELPREGENPYETAGRVLNGWLEGGVLKCDEADAFYIYDIEFSVKGETKTVSGMVTRVQLEEFDKGIVLPHEETLSKAKEDRLNLMKATGCNFSQIYSLYMDDGKITALVNEKKKASPDIETTDAEGLVHRLWIVSDSAFTSEISALFDDKKLYIADGHHRYETALNYRNYLRENEGAKKGDACDDVMMYLADMGQDGLVVFPTHRIIRGLDGFDYESLVKNCGEYFDITRGISLEKADDVLESQYNDGKVAFALYGGGEVFDLLVCKISAVPEDIQNGSAALRGLDVSILHTLVLERLMGIDKENMAKQINLTYTKVANEAVNVVKDGKANCAFLLNPTRVEEIRDVALAGEKMPQKSTYFYPKLITGLVMNKIK